MGSFETCGAAGCGIHDRIGRGRRTSSADRSMSIILVSRRSSATSVEKYMPEGKPPVSKRAQWVPDHAVRCIEARSMTRENDDSVAAACDAPVGNGEIWEYGWGKSSTSTGMGMSR